MEGTSNYAKEVSLGSSATYFDKERGESGFSGEAASGDDEASEDSSMVPSDQSQNGVPRSPSIASHLGSNIRTNGGFDPMEEVNPNHLSIGNHFGPNANHQLHLGSQLHSGNTLQFGRQAVGSQSRMQWIYQQMLQEEHTPSGQRTG